MSHAKRLWLTVLVTSVSVVAVHAVETPLTTIRVASGLVQPLYVTHAPGDYDRIFIVEQTGAIRILKRGVLLPEPFLDVSGLVTCCNERGLLGLAFHPEYAQNGSFFIDYTDANGDTVVARYGVSDDPDVADPAGETILLVDQPYANHNGGWIDFGPDGYLYIALGDGGSLEDPENRGQSIEGDLLGNLLRIDVDSGDAFPDDDDRNYTVPEANPFIGQSGEDEIWAYGLRNPWRNAFDTLTGDLYIADVGQLSWEELNVQAADSNGGENYGWNCFEGSECTTFGACDCDALDAVLPVLEYTHFSLEGHCSITGGEVYRGCAIPDLAGTYFFADFCSNTIWSATLTAKALGVRDRTVELAPDNPLNIRAISSFGRDAAGEIYICDLIDGEVFKIVPDPQVHQSATNPPDGAIDARRHLADNEVDRVGWDAVDMTFDASPECLDFSVSVEGSDNPSPVVEFLVLTGSYDIRVILDRVIDVAAWTTIFHHESASTLRIGVLPGDVDASRISGPLDILALINHLLDSGDTLAEWSSDIDRSGSSDENDVVELLAVLGGGSGADPFLGASLP